MIISGKYAREYAIPCSYADRFLFEKMRRYLLYGRRHIWVRRIEIGDIIPSPTKILRWRIVEDERNHQMYLGYVEAPQGREPYRHSKSSLYVVELEDDLRLPRYKLCLIKNRNLLENRWSHS